MNAHVALSAAQPAIADAAFYYTLNVLGLNNERPGSVAWWQQIAACGTPLIRDAGNGETELTFLWRDPAGQAEHSPWQRVFIDVYSHTPHPTRQPTSLQRYCDTDIWFWQTQVADDWCGSYVLLPANGDQLPPANNGQMSASAYASAIRRWWCTLLASNGCADGMNLLAQYAGAWGNPLNAIQLAAADVDPVWDAVSQYPARGHMHHWRWRSEGLNNERDIWLYRCGAQSAEQQSLPLVILLDGHYWARSDGFFAALDRLTAQGALKPAVYLLVDAVDADTRSRELPCNPEFWLLLQQQLLPQAYALETFTDDPAQTIVAGQSFGGLAAMYAALNWPRRFGAVFSQSGSFWWPDVDEVAGNGWLTRELNSAGSRRHSLRVELEIGCYEDSMLGVNRAMYEALQAAGVQVNYREFRGGHDWLCWRHGLFQGLGRLMAPIL